MSLYRESELAMTCIPVFKSKFGAYLRYKMCKILLQKVGHFLKLPSPTKKNSSDGVVVEREACGKKQGNSR